MDNLKLNYFTGMIRITGFKMYEPDDKTEFLSFDTLKVNLEHLQLETFTGYAAKYAGINKLDGLFNSQIILDGNIKEAEKSLLSGYIEILDFVMEDKNNKKFLGAKRMDCILKELDAENMSVIIDSLTLTEPYVYFELDTSTNNYFEIFSIKQDTGATAETAGITVDTAYSDNPDSIYWAVNFIRISDGIIDYTDNLTGEPFDYYLSEITMDADSIESTSDWVDLYAEMLLNKRGTLKAEVGLNPSNPLDIKLDYVITDFQLGDLNIYSRYYMGFPIVYGDLYYKSDTKIESGQLTSENKLVIKNVELGNKSGGLYKLPLKFALFLLKDRHGVINLDIPVRGDLNDPRVSVGKIVWNTFKNLIIKVAAAPFDFLSGLLKVDPNDIKSIEFDYLDTTLTAKKQRQLDLLLELEQKKEGLGIELVYFNDIEIEKEIIAMDEVGKMFYVETGINYMVDENAFRQFIHTKLPDDTLELKKTCLRIADPVLVDSLAKVFADKRYSVVNNYLSVANDSTMIRSSVSNPKAPKNGGSKPIFEVKYTMKEEETGDE